MIFAVGHLRLSVLTVTDLEREAYPRSASNFEGDPKEIPNHGYEAFDRRWIPPDFEDVKYQ